jgi:hypothetical protein
MAHTLSDLSTDESAFVAVSARDLVAQATRRTLLVAAVATWLWLLLVGMARSELAAQAMPAGLALAVVTFAALRLPSRPGWLGQAAFLVGWWAVVGFDLNPAQPWHAGRPAGVYVAAGVIGLAVLIVLILFGLLFGYVL